MAAAPNDSPNSYNNCIHFSSKGSSWVQPTNSVQFSEKRVTGVQIPDIQKVIISDGPFIMN